MHKKNIFLCLLDWKSASDSVDHDYHDCLIRIMAALEVGFSYDSIMYHHDGNDGA